MKASHSGCGSQTSETASGPPTPCSASSPRAWSSAPKIGQHILEAPAGIAELTPMIEICRLAADIQKAVDRTRPTQHFPARLDDAPVIEFGFRLRGIEPVHLGIGEQLAVTERDVNPDVPVVTTGFEEQNAIAPRGGQAIGEHAASRAGTDHNVVERTRIS